MALMTKNCVICFSPDIICYGGHVHDKGKRMIIASFCEECHLVQCPHYKGCQGCFGDYRKEMGIKNDDF